MILSVTKVYVRWRIDYGKKKTNKTLMIKRIDMSLVKHTDELKSISKDGARCPKKWYEMSRRKERFQARRGQQAAASPPRHRPSPAAMEIEARELSPIRTLDKTLSQVNATPAPKGRDPFNETTQLKSTTIGGHQLDLYDDDPGSSV